MNIKFKILFTLAFLPSVVFGAEKFQAKWKFQDQGIWGAEKAHVIFPGKQLVLTAKFENVGTECWSNDDTQDYTNVSDNFVGFYVYKDSKWSTPLSYNDVNNTNVYGTSLWAGLGWGPSRDGKTQNARAAKLKESEVCPGQIGAFVFTINAPSTTEYSNPYLNNSDTNIDDRIHREDLSLAVSRNWMKADAPYPNGTGDPEGIAHVWFPIRFEDNVLKQEEVDAAFDLGTNILDQVIPAIGAWNNYEILHFDDKSEIRHKRTLAGNVISKLIDIRGEYQIYEPPFELLDLKKLNFGK